MPGQVPNAQKALRAAEAARRCEALERDYLQSRIGLVRPVLFEQEEEPGVFTGHIPEYCLVRAKGEDLHNRILPVRISGVRGTTLTGEIVHE